MLNDLTELANLIGTVQPKRKARNQSKVNARKPKETRSAAPSINTSKLQRVLTSDPWETLGVELHISVVTCSHCGKVYRSPLSGTNTLSRRVQRRQTYRTPHERIVNGPSPWIATSIPQNEQELEEWKDNIPSDWPHGYETVEHHSTAARCEACTTEAQIPDGTTGQMRLTGLVIDCGPRIKPSQIPTLPESRQAVKTEEAYCYDKNTKRHMAYDHFWAQIAFANLEN